MTKKNEQSAPTSGAPRHTQIRVDLSYENYLRVKHQWPQDFTYDNYIAWGENVNRLIAQIEDLQRKHPEWSKPGYWRRPREHCIEWEDTEDYKRMTPQEREWAKKQIDAELKRMEERRKYE